MFDIRLDNIEQLRCGYGWVMGPADWASDRHWFLWYAYVVSNIHADEVDAEDLHLTANYVGKND